MSKAIKPIDLTQEVIDTSDVGSNARALLKEFGAPFEHAGKLLATYKDIVVKDESDTASMAKARETRLELRKERIAIEKQHKVLKADVLVKGRAIDHIKNTALAEIEPAEAYLKEQEEFAERAEQKRREERIAKRTEILAKYTEDVSIYNYGDMADDAFEELLRTVKAAHDLKIEAEAKRQQEEIEAAKRAEEERKAREEADRLAREEAEKKAAALQAELEAERKVQAEKDAALAAERAKQEAERAEAARIQAQKDAEAAAALKAEQERAAKLQADAEALKQAEAKRLADEAEAAKKAAAAPDKEKLLAWVDMLGETDGVGVLSTSKAEAIAERIGDHFTQALDTYRKLIEKEL